MRKFGAKLLEVLRKGDMVLLALCVLVSYFNVDALLLTWIARVLRGALGWGYYLTAPALAAVAVIQLGHKGRPVILRTVCVAVLPLLIGVLCHLALCRTAYEFGGGLAGKLWADGQALRCGGVVAGGLAVGCEALLSKVVSIVVFVVLLLAALLGALHMTPQEAAERVRSYGESLRRDEDDDFDDLPEDFTPASAPVSEKKSAAKRKKRPSIDIPLDGENDGAVIPPASSFFPRRSEDVRTPDQVLRPPVTPPAPIGGEETAAAPEAPAPKKPLSDKQKKAQLQQEVETAAQEVSDAIEQELAQGEETYRYPPITLLEENRGGNYTEVGAELRNNSKRLADTLRSFGVDAKAGEVIHGPSVTRYEFTLDQGVKLSKITNLQDDIALALGASGVRIAPVPNKISAVGIEVPNRTVTAVRIRDVIESREFINHPSPVAFAVGKDIGGNNIVGNIARLPHVLIAGTTGSGKSVCTNSLIVSMLYKSTPDEVRFIMVDPKMVELAPYNGIPHLLIPVVTDPKKAAGALQWAVFEMMKRYKMFSEKGVKDLAGYNALSETDEDVKKLPTVVVVIDELADLMLVAAKEVEESICRVAQMGRAAGMHLVIATQRPSADVITGLIKANIPSRIAFHGVPHHSGHHRRGKAGGQGRHAVLPAGRCQAHPRAGLLHHAGGDRPGGEVRQGRGGRGTLRPGRDREDPAGGGRQVRQGLQGRHSRCTRRRRGRRRAAARRRGGGAGNGTGLRVHAPAAVKAGLFPRRASGGSDGGAGLCGPLRGQQAPAAAHHPREVAGAANGQGRISGGAGQARRPLRQHQRRIRKPRRIRISISKALRSEGFTVTPCR